MCAFSEVCRCVRGMEIGNIAGRIDIDVYITVKNKLLIISSISTTYFDPYGPSSCTKIHDSHDLNRIFVSPVKVYFSPWCGCPILLRFHSIGAMYIQKEGGKNVHTCVVCAACSVHCTFAIAFLCDF